MPAWDVLVTLYTRVSCETTGTYEGAVHDEHHDAKGPVVDEGQTQTQDDEGEDEGEGVQDHLRHDPFLRLSHGRRLDDLRAGRDLLLQRGPSRRVRRLHAIVLIRLEGLAVGAGILDVLGGARRELRLLRVLVSRSRSRSVRGRRRCGWSLGGHSVIMVWCVFSR